MGDIDDIPFTDEDEFAFFASSPPTCNRCGTENLEWVDIGGAKPRWRLYDGMKSHVCPNNAKVSDFPDLTK